MKHILLDTNAYTHYMRGDVQVFSYIVEAEAIYLSTIVAGELFAGFYGGYKFKQNKEELELFIKKSTVRVAGTGLETSEIFGELKNELKKKGTPLPINDLWIAAQSIETGSKLITYDKHFINIPGLRVWSEINNLT